MRHLSEHLASLRSDASTIPCVCSTYEHSSRHIATAADGNAIVPCEVHMHRRRIGRVPDDELRESGGPMDPLRPRRGTSLRLGREGPGRRVASTTSYHILGSGTTGHHIDRVLLGSLTSELGSTLR